MKILTIPAEYRVFLADDVTPDVAKRIALEIIQASDTAPLHEFVERELLEHLRYCNDIHLPSLKLGGDMWVGGAYKNPRLIEPTSGEETPLEVYL